MLVGIIAPLDSPQNPRSLRRNRINALCYNRRSHQNPYDSSKTYWSLSEEGQFESEKKIFFVILTWVHFIKIFHIIEFNFFFLDNKNLFKGKYKKNIPKTFETSVDEISNVLLM